MAKIDAFEDHCWKDLIPPQDIALYAPYARDTYVGPRPALLLIDLYDLAYRGGPGSPYELDKTHPNSCGMFAHQVIEPTKRLIAAARAAGLPVFYCTQDTRPFNRPPGAFSTHRPLPPQVPEDYAIRPEFAPEAGDVVIYKQRASVFQGTPLAAHLTLLGIESLIVCGQTTSGCVRASVVDAYSSGYHVSIVEECTFDRSEFIHKVNLFDLHHKYADVMHLDEVEGVLGSVAADRVRAAG